MPLISSTTKPQHKATKTAGPSSGIRKTNEKKVSCRHHRTSLQTLPAKLKNKIYEYVLFSGHRYANLTPAAICEFSKDAKSIHLSGNPVLLHVWSTSKLHLLGGKTREIAARLVDNAKFDVSRDAENRTLQAWRHFHFNIGTFEQDTRGGCSNYKWREVHVKFNQAQTGFKIFGKRAYNSTSAMQHGVDEMMAGEFGDVRFERIVRAAEKIVKWAGKAGPTMSRILFDELVRSVVRTF